MLCPLLTAAATALDPEVLARNALAANDTLRKTEEPAATTAPTERALCPQFTAEELAVLQRAGIKELEPDECALRTRDVLAAPPIKRAAAFFRTLLQNWRDQRADTTIADDAVPLLTVSEEKPFATTFNASTWDALDENTLPLSLALNKTPAQFTSDRFEKALALALGVECAISTKGYEAARAAGAHLKLTAAKNAAVSFVYIVQPDVRQPTPTFSAGQREPGKRAAAETLFRAFEIIARRM